MCSYGRDIWISQRLYTTIMTRELRQYLYVYFKSKVELKYIKLYDWNVLMRQSGNNGSLELLPVIAIFEKMWTPTFRFTRALFFRTLLELAAKKMMSGFSFFLLIQSPMILNILKCTKI